MATTILYPNTTVTSVGWAEIGSEGSIHAALADDDGLNTGAEGSGFNRYIEVTLDDLDSAGLNIDSITSIKATMEARTEDRNQSAVLRCDYRDSSGDVINSYTQDITVTATGTNTAYAWSSRATSDGSTAWSDSDIDGMRLRITIATAPLSGNAEVLHLYLTVTYTEPVVPTTYTSDDQVTLSGGMLELKNGRMKIG